MARSWIWSTVMGDSGCSGIKDSNPSRPLAERVAFGDFSDRPQIEVIRSCVRDPDLISLGQCGVVALLGPGIDVHHRFPKLEKQRAVAGLAQLDGFGGGLKNNRALAELVLPFQAGYQAL